MSQCFFCIIMKNDMKKAIWIICVLLITQLNSFAQVTLVNYDFNAGTSYASLTPTLQSGVSCAVSSTETWLTYSGVVSGANAFTSNTSSGNALGMSNSGGTNTRYWTFALNGSNLANYTNFKVYLQSQRSAQGAQIITLSYSTNGTNFTNFSTTGAPGNGSYAEIQFNLSAISALNNTNTLYIRLMASNAGGTGTGTGTLRIDNFQVQGVYNPASTPIITLTQSISEFVCQAIGNPSASQSLNIDGQNLTSNINVTMPSGFEVSYNGSSYASSLSLSPNAGTVSARVSVRYNPASLANQNTAPGTQISVSSTGATTKTIDVYGVITNLSIGDFAVIGIDASTTDAIAFVALKTIPQGSIIKFTDNGYADTINQMTIEGVISYTALTTLTPGTIVKWNNGMNISVTGWSVSAPTDFALSTSGDQLFAFQGNWGVSGGYSVIHEGFNYGNSGWVTGTNSSNNNSVLPSVLANGRALTVVNANLFYTNNTANTIITPSDLFVASYTLSRYTTSGSQVTFPNWSFSLLEVEPTSPGQLFSSTNITTDSFDLNFSGGNGTSCIITMRKSLPITNVPSDGSNYTANATYGNGSTITGGDFVVYNGSSSNTSVRIKGLVPGAVYYYAIFTYNGSGNASNYLTNPIVSDSTISIGYFLSNNSKIIIDSTYQYHTNIPYQYYQTNTIGIPNNNNDIDIGQFIVLDGDGITYDNDTNSTIIDSISFQITKYKTLRKIAIYDGNIKLDEVASAKNITFHNLNFWVPDNGYKTFQLRASFENSVTDSTQFYATITNAYSNSNGSGFSSSNAGGAVTSTTGNNNRIDVVATKLSYTQQASNVSQHVIMYPFVSLIAVDTFNNQDLSYNLPITAQSNALFDTNATTMQYAFQGAVSFSNIRFANVSKNNSIWFSGSNLIYSDTSTLFDVFKSANPGDVIISEIMYNVTGNNEWAELYNTTNDTIDISNWYLTDASSYPPTNEGAITFQSGTKLLPHEYRAVSVNGVSQGSITNDILDISNELRPLAYYSTGLQLNNSGDNLALYNGPIMASLIDGSLTQNYVNILPGSQNGISIERKKDSTWSPTSWALSTTPYASTIMTLCTPNEANLPLSPNSLTHDSIGTTQFKLIWSSVKSNNMYYVDIATDSGFTSCIPNYTKTLVTNDTTIWINGLITGTKYFARVQTLSHSYNSSNYSNTDSVKTIYSGSNLIVKTFLEGYMKSSTSMVSALFNADGISGLSLCDSIKVTFVDSSSLSDIYTTFTILDTTGNAQITLPPSINGNNVYIAVKHRGHITTWSAKSYLINGTIQLDLTVDPNNTFGSNVLDLKNGYFAIYGGDVNNDGVVSNDDMVSMDNDNSTFNSGYLNTDMNGDSIITNDDIVILDNNNSNFIAEIKP